MATHPMKKMNKSHKKKLRRLEARQKHYDMLCSTLRSPFGAAHKRPGAVK